MIDRQLLPLVLMDANDKQPIEGRTRLQKMVFLMQQEFAEKDESLPGEYQYIPYDYGPFAKKLYDDIDDLADRHVIDEDPETIEDGKVKYYYRLGRRGDDYLHEWSDAEVKRVQKVAERIKRNYNEMPLPQLLDHVYTKYPEYAENSVL
jgi:uncharacterized protein YwgA